MIEYQIASVPDRQRVVLELWRDRVQVGEISNEDGVFRVEIYTYEDSGVAEFLAEELEDALKIARKNLVFG